MAPVQIALFSSFEATRDGQPIPGLTSSKIQALLAYLALEADRAHPRETLAALLWPDHSGHNAMQNKILCNTTAKFIEFNSSQHPEFACERLFVRLFSQ